MLTDELILWVVIDADVLIKNLPPGNYPIQQPGIIWQKVGPLSFEITLPDCQVIGRHLDHIHKSPSRLPSVDSDSVVFDTVAEATAPLLDDTSVHRASTR